MTDQVPPTSNGTITKLKQPPNGLKSIQTSNSSLPPTNRLVATTKQHPGPKIFANALCKALEGAVNLKTLTKMQQSIKSKPTDHYMILFRNGQNFRGLYQYDEKQNLISKIDGLGPKTVNNEDITKYYKYEAPKRQFVEVQTTNIGLTIIGFSIHDHLWGPKKVVAAKPQTT